MSLGQVFLFRSNWEDRRNEVFAAERQLRYMMGLAVADGYGMLPSFVAGLGGRFAVGQDVLPWALTTAVLAATSEAQTTVYVDDDAAPGGDGLSWATAYQFLQDGLALRNLILEETVI